MECEDDRPIAREQRVERLVGQAIRVLGRRLQLHQVDDVHHSDFQGGQMLTHNGNGRQRLQRRYIAAASHDHVGRSAPVVAGPLPDADPRSAVLYGGVHFQPVRRRVFAGDHDVDVMTAAQAMIHHRQQAVCIRRKVNSNDLGLLVHDQIDETGILVSEPVVILAPDMRSQQVV